jgi:hypothetical protein
MKRLEFLIWLKSASAVRETFHAKRMFSGFSASAVRETFKQSEYFQGFAAGFDYAEYERSSD